MVEQTTISGDFEWTFSWFRSEPYWFKSVSTKPGNPKQKLIFIKKFKF